MQKKILRTAVAVTVGVGSSVAMAALPPEATAAFGQVSTGVTDVLAAVWPIVAAVVGGFTLIKLFKKGASKAV